MPVGAFSGKSRCFSISGRDQVLAAGPPASPPPPSAHPVVRAHVHQPGSSGTLPLLAAPSPLCRGKPEGGSRKGELPTSSLGELRDHLETEARNRRSSCPGSEAHIPCSQMGSICPSAFRKEFGRAPVTLSRDGKNRHATRGL